MWIYLIGLKRFILVWYWVQPDRFAGLAHLPYPVWGQTRPTLPLSLISPVPLVPLLRLLSRRCAAATHCLGQLRLSPAPPHLVAAPPPPIPPASLLDSPPHTPIERAYGTLTLAALARLRLQLLEVSSFCDRPSTPQPPPRHPVLLILLANYVNFQLEPLLDLSLPASRGGCRTAGCEPSAASTAAVGPRSGGSRSVRWNQIGRCCPAGEPSRLLP